jgi:hypothetical protein
MVAINPPTLRPAYGAVINADGASLADTEDGIPVVGPSLNAAAGNLSAAVISSVANPDAGIPVLNAILIEFRVQNTLLHAQLGATNYDFEQMRADELYNTMLSTGMCRRHVMSASSQRESRLPHTWRPTLADLELIVDMGKARASSAQTAGALGISEAEFNAWASRLVATRTLDFPKLYRDPMQKSPGPRKPRITADRMFEAQSEPAV